MLYLWSGAKRAPKRAPSERPSGGPRYGTDGLKKNIGALIDRGLEPATRCVVVFIMYRANGASDDGRRQPS
jgi:hypothetical protein